MNSKDRKRLREIAKRQKVLADEQNALAEEVEAYVMKKTTQGSNEWFGGANC